jgi:DNA invertase Pin-like site-specific DNA recombinase
MRCSGESQVDGDTWNRQQFAIQRYALASGFTIAKEFRDAGVPGKTELEDRLGLSDCMLHCREHKVTVVLVESSDRLARDLIVSELILREFQRIGVRVISANGGVDLTEGSSLNPTAKLIRQILAAVAEFEKNTIVLRTRAARERIKQRDGKCEGQKPYGHYEKERPILDVILARTRENFSSDAIAATFNRLDVPTRSGKPWRGSTIRKILASVKRSQQSQISKTR